MKLSILGTEYTVTKKKYDDDPMFKDHSYEGYCDSIMREIVYCDALSFPGWENETPERAALCEKETLRHEIVHAFLEESGLQACALVHDGAWAKNEEMVDWIALQSPKIYAAWTEAGAV